MPAAEGHKAGAGLDGIMNAVNDEPVWDERAQRVYLTHLARDVRIALVALEESKLLANTVPPDPRLWASVDTFLTYAARLSKMVKPIDGARPKKDLQKQAAYDRRKLRGEKLRELLGVEETSAVLSRSVRDSSEHFDERLDAWVFEQERFTADELEAGARPAMESPPMRIVDNEAWTIEVAGDVLEIGAVGRELERILASVLRLEPLARFSHADAAVLLSLMQTAPPELRLSAPSRRPDEPVTAGLDPEELLSLEQRWAADFAKLDERGRQEPV
ncbi:hypothetical protein [Jiangella mangrovi]|uniref:Uncharacterized protein n=1 Tax=Jiangella mangrovi TaxID=1524084 RepID=A0A7W9GV47_9ACTN|nr:hypothetical protein [Jiangella mangrovi]MBB5790328.1 hypothetical protein [Jiangella mangrovi]